MSPGGRWLLGVVIVTVLTGGVAQVVAERQEPVVETTITDVEVLPEGQAEVVGTIDGFVAEDATGAPLPMPVAFESGRATIEGAIVDGERATIAWDGGRPFRLAGTGAIDLGPAHVEMGMGAVFWTLDGLRILSSGEYTLGTPVAVGRGGLATPRDSVRFVADEETTITTGGHVVVARPLPVRLEGPGTFVADGRFTVTTRSGTVAATRLEFGPGAFVVDVDERGAFTAVFNGPLTST